MRALKAELIAAFAAAWERVGGNAHTVADLAEARVTVQSIVAGLGIETAVAWESPLLGALNLAPLFTWYRTPAAGGPAGTKAACAEAGVGITTAALGAADTGTLVMPFGGPRPRSVLILPPVWIAVVPAERLVPGRVELFRHLGALLKGSGAPAELGLATGPSRTGDIESMLLQGIHGPGTAHVILVQSVDPALV